ncbi:hypothetical protein HMPREF0972_00574 [Actinomyces sp. oral taxon 848 str. F0332]|nr:hypothetical protein HMPREF0972_00574 [Actinomyces sp. oral taxon 848 str. F0332]
MRIGSSESPTRADDGAPNPHFEISRNNDPSALSQLSRANSRRSSLTGSPVIEGRPPRRGVHVDALRLAGPSLREGAPHLRR